MIVIMFFTYIFDRQVQVIGGCVHKHDDLLVDIIQ